MPRSLRPNRSPADALSRDLQFDLFAEPLAPAPAPAAVHAQAPAAPVAAQHPHRLFRHPRANRDIVFGEHRVGYELKRGRRRTIGMVIGEDGLAVSAPRWVPQGDIDTALHGKSAWILRKLMDQHERLNRLEAARVDWRDGTELPYLGEPLVVQLDPGVNAAVLLPPSATATQPAHAILRVGLPRAAEPAQIRDAVQSWLQRQALAVFDERCRLFADRLGVQIRQLKLSSATTRWGSATADGTIRLHWRLVHFALPTIDYVVAHELAHLREMNHSPAFWDVVRSVLPDFESARGSLRSDALPVFE